MNKRNLALILILLALGCFPLQRLVADQPTQTQASVHCPPLDPPSGVVVNVSTEADLRSQALNAAADTTIMIQAGVYDMQAYLHVGHDGITLRGATGNRDDVILDFGGIASEEYSGIYVDVDRVTIADLSIRNAQDHGVSIQGRDDPVLYNLHIYDIGDQLVKVNPEGNGSEDGLLACSRLEYTTAAPDEYTNGISAHNAHRWVVRDNEWYRIRTPGNAPVPTILFWSGSSDTVVERNLLVNCYQGIAFGNAYHGPGDHFGGIVRNNIMYASMQHDVAIEMVHADGWVVAHNTALLLNPPSGLTWGMEARYSDSQGTFAYNLSNLTILADRDDAQGNLVGNVTTAEASWFADAASANLHLLATATDAIDQAATRADVTDDFDGDARPSGSAPDVGADEYTVAAPVAVTDLFVTHAVSGGGLLTATLRWSAPADAVTYTLRYDATAINDANWDSAADIPVLFGAATETLTAPVPYAGGTLYFALKSQNVTGAWSALSNNAFWPYANLWLPYITK